MSMNETKEQYYMNEEQELEQVEQLDVTQTDNVEEMDVSAEAQQEQEDPRILELKQQVEEHQSRYLRAQADFDNYRRRTTKDKEEWVQYSSQKVIEQLLPVLDNFERAIQTAGEVSADDSFVKGVDMIYRQMFQVLEAEGLKAMQPVGEPFDPVFHQAVMRVETDEYEEGIVVEVLQTGYMMKEKVIRPAMVKVSG